MPIILTDTSNVTFYTFPDQFDLHSWDDLDWQTRAKLLDRFGQAGANQVSDKAIEPRTVKVSGAIHAASQAVLKALLTYLNKALHHNGESYRFSWETGYYINVSHCSKFQAKRLKNGLAYKSVEIEIEFVCPDPFWYYTSDDTATAYISGSPATIAITNNGNVPSPLTITVEPYAVGGWTDFTIVASTDDSNKFRYMDANFAQNNTLIVNGLTGAVEREGFNTIHFFKGAFLRILPGANSIVYTGPTNGDITLTAPRRYL